MIVQTIYRDSVGYAWFGTLSGIDRFDGIYIKNYPYGTNAETGKSTYAFLETPEYGLLAGASNGLWQLDRKSDRFVRLFEEELSQVHALAYRDGDLYVGTFSGLYIVRGGELRHIPLFPEHENSQKLNLIEDIEIDEKNGVWLATHRGLIQYEPETETLGLFVFELEDQRVNHIQSIGRIGDHLFLGTPYHGLIRFNRTAGQFSSFVDVGCMNVKGVDTDGTDRIYAATDGNGLQVVSAAGQKVVQSILRDPREPESISSNSIYCFLKDRDDIFWLGSYLGGVSYTYYTNDLFQTYRYGDKFDTRNYPIRNFWLGEKERLIGTRSGLVYVSEERDLVRQYTPSELQASIVCSIAENSGRFFIGTFNGGLWVLDPATLKISRLVENELSSNDVYCMVSDVQDRLWMAAGNGVFRYDALSDKLDVFKKENSRFPYNNTHYISFDRTGNGWIASQEGLTRYNATEDRFENSFPEGFQHDVLYFYIYPDSKGNILFLTFDNVFISNPEMTEFRTLKLDSLIGRYLSVVEDDEGAYWFSTNAGIYRTPDLTGESYLYFDYADNLPDMLFNACAGRDSNGNLWFGNSQGLCYIDPRQAEQLRNSVHFPIVFSSVQVDGHPLSEEQQHQLEEKNLLRLEKGEYSFSVAPVLLNYANPSSRKYEYRLEGVDRDWKTTEDGQWITYTGLKSGTYELIVRVRGSEDVNTLTVQVSRGNYFYWWLVVLLALGGSLIFMLWFWISGRRKRQAEPVSVQSPAAPGEKYKNTKRLSEEEARQIIARLRECMEVDKVYLNPNLKSADLAARTSCSPAVLSQIFSLHLNESYYDFVNAYRVEEFKNKIRNIDYNRYTLDALSKECGFNSQASFFRSFKKITGKTPNEYIQEILKEQ